MDFEIFPNPTTDILNIKPLFSNDFKLEKIVIVDQKGMIVLKKIYTDSHKESYQVNLQHLKTGVYIVRILNENHYSKGKKVIIK